MARDKPKNRPRNQQAMEKNNFLAKICEMGYKDLIKADLDESVDLEPVPCKKKRVDSVDSAVSGASYFEHVDSDSGRYEMEEKSYSASLLAPPGEYSLPTDMDLRGFDYSSADNMMRVQSDTSSVHSFNQNALQYDSDSPSSSEQEKKVFEKPKKVVEEKTVRRESLFSTQLNSEDLPWEDHLDKEMDKETEKHSKEKLVELTQYEEIQLLKKVEGLAGKVKDPSKRAYLHRLRAKLALRRLKRHKHLPLFDLDKTVRILGGYVTEDPGEIINADRVLDRFQTSYLLDSLCGTISGPLTGSTLLSVSAGAVLRSPHSGAALRPYIRRDVAARPVWLALKDELMKRTHRHIKDYQPPSRATIDYSYVRPEHIAAVNSLCAQFFWPGIDLTEALQYPEFSCVAVYKRLAVGCAFLVPDAGPNEAYISFVLVRPEWRRAGIATFMLYHLLQTCTGKDVTLHCSPTNPAIFLYQKFGFKVEELVQDFYEKYFDIEYKGCRHALFLRLAR